MLCVAAALLTFVSLSATGLIETDPIEITLIVSDESKEYDGTPLSAQSYEFKEGDELMKGHTAEVTFTGSQTEFGTSKAGLNVKITDEDGIDVTKKYAIKVEPGILTVYLRSITVVQEHVEKEYDGNMQYADEYNIASGALCSGHKLLLPENKTGRINVGTTPGDETPPIIVDAAGADVSANYRIAYTPGSVTVLRREITVIPLSDSKSYDGVPLVADKYTISAGSLVEGHKLEVKFAAKNGGDASITDAGELEFVISGFSVTSSGQDASVNYAITGAAASAKLTVAKSPLKIVGKDGEGKYNGEPQKLLDSNPLSTEGLARTDKIALNYSEFTDVGQFENTFTYVVTRDGENVSGNYTVEAEFGTYTMRKGEKVVTLKPCTIVYKTEFPALDTVASYDGSIDDLRLLLPDGIYTADALGSAKNFASVGTYSYSVEWAFTASETLTESYDLVVRDANVTVVQKTVQISLINESREYSADANYGTLGGIQDSSDTSVNDYIEMYVPEIKNVGTYTYSAGWEHDAPSEVFVNYYLSAGIGSIIIEPKKLSVELYPIVDDYTLDYTRNPITITTEYLFKPTEEGVVFIELPEELSYADFEASSPVINGAGLFNYSVRYVGSSNYAVEIGGEHYILINKGSIMASYTGNMSKVYDGRPFEIDVSKISFGEGTFDLFARSAVITSGELINAKKDGTVNSVSFKATVCDDVSGKDVTENYDITYENFELKIERRKLLVTVGNLYLDDGTDVDKYIEEYFYNTEDGKNLIKIDGKAETDNINWRSLGVSYEPSSDILEMSPPQILNAEENDVSDNYDIIMSPGKVIWRQNPAP